MAFAKLIRVGSTTVQYERGSIGLFFTFKEVFIELDFISFFKGRQNRARGLFSRPSHK